MIPSIHSQLKVNSWADKTIKLVLQPVLEKENSDFQTVKHR